MDLANYISKVRAAIFLWARRGAYRFRPGDSVVEDFAEYSGLSIADVECRMREHKALAGADWRAIDSGSFEDNVERFYENSDHYIFDLLSSNYSAEAVIRKLDLFAPQLLKSIRQHPGSRVLEFGGGTGLFCELLTRMGKEVTYLDIPGRPLDFAQWRFAKYGLPVKVIVAAPDRLELTEDYDIIFSDAVIEHLADPHEKVAYLCRHVRLSGLLILLVDAAAESEDMPMHRNVDLRRLHAVVEDHGFDNELGQGNFYSIWRKRS
jgi:SAM-dependent methyltransferase